MSYLLRVRFVEVSKCHCLCHPKQRNSITTCRVMRVNIALWHGSSQKPLIPSCNAMYGKCVLTQASNDVEFGCNPALHSPAFVTWKL